jgi:fructose PTS system EIIBC or EIIC component
MPAIVASNGAPDYHLGGICGQIASRHSLEATAMNQFLRQHKQYLLTGVSYVIPMIACGGILIATAIALLTLLYPGSMTPTGGPDFSQAPALKMLLDIGDAAFKMALPVLAGFIAYGMAGKPGLVPGLLGGYLAGTTNAGFLGALLVGLLAGHVVNLLKKMPVHRYVRPIMPILIIPIVSGVVVGAVMLKVVGVPIAEFMKFLGTWLQAMSGGNAVVLAMILGAMIAFDMGGPVNKAAFFFGAAMIKEGNFAVMGACAAAICTPPLGLGLATFLGRRLWTDEQKESGIAAIGMGMVGITEGAIPFAAGDPVRVIPSIMLGSMVAATIAMLGGVGDHAPHGGPIVLPVVDNRLIYVVAIVAGSLVTAVAINAVKRLTERTEEPAAHSRQ